MKVRPFYINWNDEIVYGVVITVWKWSLEFGITIKK